MPTRVCENCGSTHLVEEEGLLVCKSCGTIYYDNTPEYTDIEQDARKKEIERLIEANRKTTTPNSETEPRIGLLTDEEILKYAPNSEAAKEIKFKNADTIREKIMYNDDYQLILWAGIPIFLFCLIAIIVKILVG